MCLYAISEELTAKEDILVYKVIHDNNKSAHQKFKYEPNKLYRLRKKLGKIHKNSIFNNWGAITKGFHSYIELEVAESQYTNWIDVLKIVKFTIPKGAKYYKGGRGDIVSSSIRSGDLLEIVGNRKE